jgi:cytidine deaminase
MSLSDEMLAKLIGAARAAHKRAYAPYSHFRVGAAVLVSDGSIFSGCNIENASYGLTICAERTAVFQAVSAGKCEIEGVAVYTPTPEPTAPCGACRQVILEFAPDAEVVSACDGPATIRMNARALLPESFGHGNMHCSGYGEQEST